LVNGLTCCRRMCQFVQPIGIIGLLHWPIRRGDLWLNTRHWRSQLKWVPYLPTEIQNIFFLLELDNRKIQKPTWLFLRPRSTHAFQLSYNPSRNPFPLTLLEKNKSNAWYYNYWYSRLQYSRLAVLHWHLQKMIAGVKNAVKKNLFIHTFKKGAPSLKSLSISLFSYYTWLLHKKPENGSYFH
jgi:hypothetical protein